MMRILSIGPTTTTRLRTPEWGQYNVVIELDGAIQTFEYTCELSEQEGLARQSVTWTPEHAVLAGLGAIELMDRVAITDLVMQYHRGAHLDFPHVVRPSTIEPGTTVIKL
jgi:hypothetical protein